ncbi:MAG TPA: biotin/lipoyl-containing protein, partial [Chryseosolibacter sp.]
MGIQVKVPSVGESISEVTIGNWLKKDGEAVKLDEVIAELESDKATFELTAQNEGILKIIKQAGETVPVGEVICEIDPNGKAAASKPATTKEEAQPKKEDAPASAPPKSTGAVKEMKVPAVGESITEVTISTWLKKDGDIVRLDDVIAEVESDKATFELPAEANGVLRIVAKENETLPIGGLICRIEIMEGVPDTSSQRASAPDAATAAGTSEKSYAAGHPSPAAAKIIDEKGMTTTQVQGTGVGGRITKEDAQKAQPAQDKAPDVKKAEVPSGPPVISDGVERSERRERMSSLRRTIARRLVAVKNETAMLTTFNEVDMKPVMELRSRYKE